ncbi:two-component sensor histidine kinase [Paenibacillus sp. J23TS9]|uniref:HAMP domain-containing sensor histidine kinase n=1 Tax=Paenibacillus sp. J23TS9 TaxID=2807193 RepID=UPI001B122786|nr:HAMP domain-containing sensor histidine kinase [Paenibacillus sp. J23TS9]GIP26343.1 two-component sensor histidine kinase [Paenibacillus sp. J23TS9]
MLDVVRNPEWKSIVVKVIAIHLMLAVIMYLFLNHQVGQIHHALVNQNAALVGHVLKQDPQLENDMIHLITQGAQQSEIEEGKRVLAQYAYKENMSVGDQPVFANNALSTKTAAAVLLFCIPFLLLLLWEYRKIFEKIRTISIAAEQIVEHQLEKRLPDNIEGDFGALGRSFNTMAERLHNSLEQLKQERTFLRNLLSDISHQLKTPLASLIVFNENLLNDPDMKQEIRKKFLERSGQQLERMEWLIISLLKLARVEAGAIRFHKEHIRLREIIDHAVQSLRMLAEQKTQKIHIHGDRDLCVRADEEWLTEALINLMKNAMEHSPPEGIIDITLEENPLFTTLIIRDQGEGISPEDLPHIFERFYRGGGKTKSQSIGIGLSLSKSIIEEQGGIITVSSEPGRGTEFKVSFHKGDR